MQVDLNNYKEFVKEVTSKESNYTSFMHEHQNKLEKDSGVCFIEFITLDNCVPNISFISIFLSI